MLLRNDFNIIFGFLFLGMMHEFFHTNNKNCIKIMFHLVVLLLIFDVFWYFMYKSVNLIGDDKESLSTKKLLSLRVTVTITFLIEFLIKTTAVFILVNEYKDKYGLDDLFVVDYLEDVEASTKTIVNETEKSN